MPLIISGGGSASTVTWANVTGKPTTLANFDVNATDIGDEKILQWDATESEWVYVENSGGVTVDTTPTDGDTTDAISSDWAYDHENAALSTGKAHVPDNSSAADNSFLAKDGTWQVPSGTGTGEANGGINIGTAGVGIFDSKSGVNLQFKKINAGSNKITITDDTANDEVDIDVDTSNFGLTASDISDFDTEVSNNTDVDANTTARHDAVTVTDTSEIDFTLAGQDIQAALKDGSIALARLDSAVQTSLSKADSALQSGDDVSVLTNDAGYITDISGKADVIGTPTTDNLIKQDESGNNADAGVAVNDSGATVNDLWTANKIDSEITALEEFDINEQTELAEAPADDDELGLYDTSATGLKKVTYSNVKAGIVNDSITDGNTDTAPSEDAVDAELTPRPVINVDGTQVTSAVNINIVAEGSLPTDGGSDGSNGDIWLGYSAT